MERILLSIPEDLLRSVKAKAETEGVTTSAFIRKVLRARCPVQKPFSNEDFELFLESFPDFITAAELIAYFEKNGVPLEARNLCREHMKCLGWISMIAVVVDGEGEKNQRIYKRLVSAQGRPDISGRVLKYLEKVAEKTTIKEILCFLEVPVERMDQRMQNRVSAILRSNGWKCQVAKRREDGRWISKRVYVRLVAPEVE